MNKNNYDKFNNIYNYTNFISLLNDGLISTYPIKTTIKLLKREIGYLKIQAKIDSDIKTNTAQDFIRIKRCW